MADVAYRLVHAELILKQHTIVPHIEAVKRMLSGDRELLDITLDADEFDILSAGPMSFVQLPSDHNILVGYDSIDVVQAFGTLLYLNSDDVSRVALNKFVAEKLKSKKQFLDLDREQQMDILNTYWDHLRALGHKADRLIAFVLHILCPILRRYAEAYRFRLFSTRAVKQTLNRIYSLNSEFGDSVPSQDFFEKSRAGGIQGAL